MEYHVKRCGVKVIIITISNRVILSLSHTACASPSRMTEVPDQQAIPDFTGQFDRYLSLHGVCSYLLCSDSPGSTRPCPCLGRLACEDVDISCAPKVSLSPAPGPGRVSASWKFASHDGLDFLREMWPELDLGAKE